jgi:hypothetical protein
VNNKLKHTNPFETAIAWQTADQENHVTKLRLLSPRNVKFREETGVCNARVTALPWDAARRAADFQRRRSLHQDRLKLAESMEIGRRPFLDNPVREHNNCGIAPTSKGMIRLRAAKHAAQEKRKARYQKFAARLAEWRSNNGAQRVPEAPAQPPADFFPSNACDR